MIRHLRRLRDLRLLRGLGSEEGYAVFAVDPFVRDYFQGTLTNIQRAHQHIWPRLAVIAGKCNDANMDEWAEIVHHILEAGHPTAAFEVFEKEMSSFDIIKKLGRLDLTQNILREFLPEGSLQNDPPEWSAFQQNRFYAIYRLVLRYLGDIDNAILCNEKMVENSTEAGAFFAVLAQLELARLYTLRGMLAQAREELDKAFDTTYEHCGTRLLVGCFECASQLDMLEGETKDALSNYREALDCSQKPYQFFADRRVINSIRRLKHMLSGRRKKPEPYTNHVLGSNYVRLGRSQEAIRILRDVRIEYEQLDIQKKAVEVDLLLANALRLEKRLSEATDLIESAVDWATEVGDREVLAGARLVQAHIAIDESTLATALSAAQQGVQIAKEYGFGLLWIDLKISEGRTCLKQGQNKAAEECAQLALNGGSFSSYPTLLGAMNPACGYAWGQSDALHLLGEAKIAAGLYEEAERWLRQAFEVRRRIRHPERQATAVLLQSMRSSSWNGSHMDGART